MLLSFTKSNLKDTREMQINLLRDRSNSIDVQIRKHQARLHSIELKRLQHTPDEKNLEEMVIVFDFKLLYACKLKHTPFSPIQ